MRPTQARSRSDLATLAPRPADGVAAPSGAGWRPIILLSLAILGISTSYTNHGPLIPLLTAELSFSPSQAGLLSTAFYLALALFVLAALFTTRWLDFDRGPAR